MVIITLTPDIPVCFWKKTVTSVLRRKKVRFFGYIYKKIMFNSCYSKLITFLIYDYSIGRYIKHFQHVLY